MARMLLKLSGRRGVLVAIAVVAAALSAKGTGMHTYGFFDGPH